MKPQTRNPQTGESDRSDVTPTTLFAALAARRRQRTLRYLSQKPAAIHIGDLAEYIAITEDEPSHDRYQRILVDLYHTHLPHLSTAGLVSYDETTELVSLTVDRDVIEPYLRLLTD